MTDTVREVDILRTGWLSVPIGPTQTLNRILRDKALFLNRGYDIRVFTSDIISPRRDGHSVTLKAKIKKKIKTFLMRLGRYSSAACKLCIKNSLWTNANSLVRYYIAQHHTPDIIVFHDFYSCYYYLKYANTSAKIILFYHNDGLMFDSLLYYYPKLNNSHYYQELLCRERYVLSRIDKVVFVAEKSQKNFLDAHVGFDISKTLVMHNGIDDIAWKDVEIAPVANPKYRICYVGTFNSRKGQDLVLRALAHLTKDKLQDIHISFIGDGNTRDELEKYAVSNGLGRYVTFCGSVKNSDIHSYLCRHNICMLVSYEEGLPISIIEAMRSGLGIIASNVGGIPELVSPNENGLLIEPNEVQVQDILERLSQYNWSDMGKISRKKFEQEYTFEKMRESYCLMLDNISKQVS